LHALVRGPRALLELQLGPLLGELLRARLLVLELGEALARLVLRGDDADRARHDEREEQEVQARHQFFSATLRTALRARGLRRTSSSPGLIARPTAVSCGLGRSRARTGTPRGSLSAVDRSRMKCFTIRSSREWKLITASRPPGASTSAACGSVTSSSSSS